MDNKGKVDNKEKANNKDLCETKIDEMLKMLVGLEITKPEAAKVAATINRWLLAILDCHKQDVEVLRKRVEELEKQLAAEKAEKVNELNTAILQATMWPQTQYIAERNVYNVYDADLYNYLLANSLSNCRLNIATMLNEQITKNTCTRLGTPTDDYV
jgi:hypothetical protein